MEKIPLNEALKDEAKVLRAFLDAEGRLIRMPAKYSKRLVLLDHFCRLFEPGVRYRETEVNAVLRAVTDDVATMRRYLVDEGFMTRSEGLYWRTGGTV